MDEATGAGTPELEVRLLGPVTVVRDGETVALGGQKPRALLSVLALEPGRVVSVDQLVEALWPGHPPGTACHAVQVYVSQLRKALGPVIATRPPGYVLELAEDRVDVHRFAHLAAEGRASLQAGDPAGAELALREALALWRGPALADFVYEPFAQAQIARLEEFRATVLEERIEADLALGRHLQLVPELEALVQFDRLRERPRAQLMLAMYRSGRQADALAAFRNARETLIEELAIEPGPELRELEAAILRQDDSLLLEVSPLAAPTMQFRRLVTVLFVDVVESLALASALDPEALGRVLHCYFETVSSTIEHHGGVVEKFAGDAVMAVFGVPVSHEDDALRAARAAVEIRAGIAALNGHLLEEHAVELAVRIGLETGEVITTPTESPQRLVAGEVVGIASRLEESASPGEVVVGEVAARLVDHAARLEALGAREMKGLCRPVTTFRLLDLEAVPLAFEQRPDAPLVGRKRELATLRRSLKRAVDGASARVVLVVAAPGVGKSRLAAELARRTRGITTLWGRCLSYGQGITYWPLREMLASAPESKECAAALAALEGETPLPSPEIAVLFRRFCESLARERPVLLVFDDVHWGEPTLLEVVEHVGEKGEAPILVVCLAREELLEEREGFLDGVSRVDHLPLEALSGDESAVLLDGLGGAALESDQRMRIFEAAEGNPLFLEQLLALGLEGGLAAEGALPATIQALLAARLDRLGPGERAVLERAAVVGKRFALDDVVALLEPEALPTAQTHLRTLVARGFVRPETERGRLRFRHVLVQEAVYRAAPKRLRADLHERYADRLDAGSPGVTDVDEFVGYHLEQAYQLRLGLGESGRRTDELGQASGRRLGAAGIRAARRADVHASTSLLRRAVAIPTLAPWLECELLTELGIALRGAGELEQALVVLDRALEVGERIDDRRAVMRARMERAYVDMTFRSTTGDELLDATTAAIPVFEATGEDRLLGRACLLAGWVHGGHHGRHQLRLEAAETALACYMRSTWPPSTAIGEIANALYFGPTPVPAAIERCQSLLATEGIDRFGTANVESYLAGLVAQTGDADRAGALLASAAVGYEELGQRTSSATFRGAIAGDVHLLAGDAAAAVTELRSVCDELERTHAYSHLASAAGALAAAFYRADLPDEAFEWTEIAERHAAPDDLDALVLWMPVRAKLLAHTKAHEEAVSLACEAIRLAETTDGLNRRAQAVRDSGEVQALAGRHDSAHSAYRIAAELFEAKGNVVEAVRTRSLLDLALV
jgi:DNA-binding SARP family transcriptional activator/tetratricopeptide (TPR) repeat protein